MEGKILFSNQPHSSPRLPYCNLNHAPVCVLLSLNLTAKAPSLGSRKMDEIMLFRQIKFVLPVVCQRPFFSLLPMPYCLQTKTFLPSKCHYVPSVKLFPAKSIKARRASFLNHGSQSSPASLASFGRTVLRSSHLATPLFINPQTYFPQTSWPTLRQDSWSAHPATSGSTATYQKRPCCVFPALSFHCPELLIPSLPTFQGPSNWQGGLSGVWICSSD